jgi:hypothetical protein
VFLTVIAFFSCGGGFFFLQGGERLVSIWISSGLLLTRLCTFCVSLKYVSLKYCVCVNHVFTFSAILLFQIPLTSAASIYPSLGICHGTSMAWSASWCLIPICIGT